MNDEIEKLRKKIEEIEERVTWSNRKCRVCVHFEVDEYERTGLEAGLCMKSPFQASEMKKDEMAITCGHDGPIFVGEDFGCVHFKKKEVD